MNSDETFGGIVNENFWDKQSRILSEQKINKNLKEVDNTIVRKNRANSSEHVLRGSTGMLVGGL